MRRKPNKLTMEPFNCIFHFINLCHTSSILLYQHSITLQLLINQVVTFNINETVGSTNYEMREMKIVCMCSCFSVSRYITGSRKSQL